MKLSIRFALFLSFLAVIWGTFFLTTTSTQLTSEKVLEEHAHVIMENIASYAMEQSQNYLSKAQRATQLTKRLLRSQVVGQENSRALESYFLEQLVTYPDIAGIYLATPQGDFFYVSRNEKHQPGGTRTKIISRSHGIRQVHYLLRDSQQRLQLEEDDPVDQYDPRVRPWYQGALSTEGIFWTDPYIFYTSQKPGITISGPSYGTDGELRGIVGVDIEIEQLSTFIAQLRIGINGQAFMLNRNRDVVAFHDVDLIKYRQPGGQGSSRLVKIDEFRDRYCRAAFTALGRAQQQGEVIRLDQAEYARFKLDGESYQAMFTPFPDPQWPWVIGMYMPENDYLGALKQNRVTNYLLTFGISVLASLLILLISRSIARPVIGLRQCAEDIAAGRYSRARHDVLPHSRFREVSETAARFEDLMDELEQTRQHRELAVENLRQKERQYTSLVENLNVGVFQIGRDGEILSANPAFARMMGCETVAELKRLNVVDLYFDQQDHKVFLAALWSRRNVEGWELQLKPVNRQEPIWVSLHCRLAGSGPDSISEGIIEDISERKRSEEMLILSERMAAVGTLSSGVAHEFNNIHTVILGFAEMGAQIEGLPETARSYFEMIVDSSLRATDLTTTLLNCSSRQDAKMEFADLNATIRESYALIERDFISAGVEMECALGEAPSLMLDRAQIGQIVLNLLINARHALIGCTTKQIRISSGANSQEAWVRIADTGCGIPDENLQEIFTPFYSTKGEHAQADSLQATVRGTGLGLAVCHTIARNHNGRIEVESRVGSGSTFTLYLPLTGTKSQSIEVPGGDVDVAAGKAHHGRILVIDDEANIRTLISQALSMRGYEVVTTDDGSEGLEIIRDRGIDLVLVDIQMPKMCGIDFLRQLESSGGAERPLAMVVSGKLTDPTKRRQYGSEVFAVLEKPFQISELLAKVAKAMAARTAPVEG